MSIAQKNAKVESTMLGVEDHGILTAFLYLDFGGSSQGFGGYSLDTWDAQRKERGGHAYGSAFIRKVLDTLEVSRWEKLVGTPCRVRADFGKVHAIGHFIKEQWFTPALDLAHLHDKAAPQGEKE